MATEKRPDSAPRPSEAARLTIRILCEVCGWRSTEQPTEFEREKAGWFDDILPVSCFHPGADGQAIPSDVRICPECGARAWRVKRVLCRTPGGGTEET